MDLYFLRHGIATAPDGWDPEHDDDRPLTDDGIAKSEATGRRLAALGIKLDAVLTSPLARARQTAEIVAQALGLEVVEEPALGPGFAERAAAALVDRHAGARGLMLVGHEPDFSTTISALIGGGHVLMKKGALARVAIDAGGPGELRGT